MMFRIVTWYHKILLLPETTRRIIAGALTVFVMLGITMIWFIMFSFSTDSSTPTDISSSEDVVSEFLTLINYVTSLFK